MKKTYGGGASISKVLNPMNVSAIIPQKPLASQRKPTENFLPAKNFLTFA